MQIKKNLVIGTVVLLLVVLVLIWIRWGPDSWNVQISGVTGDGRDIQYRIESVYTGTAESLIFKNADAGFLPPYFKFDSADLQALASRIARDCPQEPVTVHGYGIRVAVLDMFPNATAIEAPLHCRNAPSDDD